MNGVLVCPSAEIWLTVTGFMITKTIFQLRLVPRPKHTSWTGSGRLLCEDHTYLFLHPSFPSSIIWANTESSLPIWDS